MEATKHRQNMPIKLKTFLREAKLEKKKYIENLAERCAANTLMEVESSQLAKELEAIKKELKDGNITTDDDFTKLKYLVQKKMGGGGSKAMASTHPK